MSSIHFYLNNKNKLPLQENKTKNKTIKQDNKTRKENNI